MLRDVVAARVIAREPVSRADAEALVEVIANEVDAEYGLTDWPRHADDFYG